MAGAAVEGTEPPEGGGGVVVAAEEGIELAVDETEDDSETLRT